MLPLITDPERRAKRIAANYADLYFKSAEKSKGQLQFYWPALAAFVVKDIVEAFRFSREEVLQREWNSAASIARNNIGADLGSLAMSGDSPYQHVIRTYTALAKGNLWLFMDIRRGLAGKDTDSTPHPQSSHTIPAGNMLKNTTTHIARPLANTGRGFSKATI